MSLHVFASIATPYGIAANNRGDNQGGNITPLQKVLWLGDTHTTISAEAIRFALRRRFEAYEERGANRTWNEAAQPKPRNEWKDDQFSGWPDPHGQVYIDDDLLGFMSAQAAKSDGSDDEGDESDSSADGGRRKRKGKGTVTLRRGVLEVARAISLNPWQGGIDIFNASTPWANLGSKDKDNPSPYGTEVHATRYQYGIALTPERLRDKSRAAKAVKALCELGTVAGNHGRFLFDFSPDSVVFRITDDPAPRLLYCFETSDDGKTVDAPSLKERVEDGDIKGEELIIGGTFAKSETAKALHKRGAFVGVNGHSGVKGAAAEAVSRINKLLGIKG